MITKEKEEIYEDEEKSLELLEKTDREFNKYADELMRLL